MDALVRQALPALRRRHSAYFKSGPKITFAVSAIGGPTYRIGADDPAFVLNVVSASGAKALATLDQLSVAVAYLEGSLEIEGDLATALTMRRFFRDVHPIAWISRFKPSFGGRAERDRRTISSHYDEDPQFFLTFLDSRHRCYSHGLFCRDDEQLEDAMTHKLAYALEAIDVGPGGHVLEVGGGWGAFAQYAATRGIRVTTVTLSRESERYINELVATESLPVTVVRKHFLEYKSTDKYDAIVNMGVTEHIPNYGATLGKYATLLRPGGVIYLDAVAMRAKHRVSSFMSRHIYPGITSPVVLHDYLRQVARSPFDLLSVIDDRRNYSLTCQAWARRFDDARDEIVQRWGVPTYRRFRVFLWGSVAGFETGLLQAYRWTLRLAPRTSSQILSLRTSDPRKKDLRSSEQNRQDEKGKER